MNNGARSGNNSRGGLWQQNDPVNPPYSQDPPSVALSPGNRYPCDECGAPGDYYVAAREVQKYKSLYDEAQKDEGFYHEANKYGKETDAKNAGPFADWQNFQTQLKSAREDQKSIQSKHERDLECKLSVRGELDTARARILELE